ncbi:hypothetical protein TURU_103290 [Turdus rufiventris]|nr:hypothetical protein TURU_103290 [Turdus rufiventris]
MGAAQPGEETAHWDVITVHTYLIGMRKEDSFLYYPVTRVVTSSEVAQLCLKETYRDIDMSAWDLCKVQKMTPHYHSSALFIFYSFLLPILLSWGPMNPTSSFHSCSHAITPLLSSHRNYPREFYDQYAQSQEKSVVNKMQQKYWKTKQTLIKVTGKKEDEHVVASDADLDAKLEVCNVYIILALRTPLSRLYQEVETFRYRAISDTWLTVNRMEQYRTEYRGALLWMKDVSQELDPDLYKQMEKFRKVQAQVRHAKLNFDKLKTDVCQKVDLLGASRCNLLSHVLTTYQSLQDPVNKLTEKAEKEDHQIESTNSVEDQQNQLISLDEESHSKESNYSADDGKDVISALQGHCNHEQNSGAIDTLLDLQPEENGPVREYRGVSKSSKETFVRSLEPEPGDKDDMVLLNEILNASSLDEGEFSKEWTAVFGQAADLTMNSSARDGESTSLSAVPAPSGYLPSQLLDQNMNDLQSSLHESPKNPKDLTAWFSLFADLDPLSNPDAVGKTDKEHELLNA